MSKNIPEDKEEKSTSTSDIRIPVYGWLGFAPKCMQGFVSPKWALAFTCTGPFIQGVIVNGMLHYFIPTLERHFGLNSLQTGLISCAYDLACTICLIPVAHFGGLDSAHRPRYIGTGLVVLGIGAIVFASPILFIGPHRQKEINILCTTPEQQVKTPEAKKHSNWWLLLIGNVLHGAGASPIYSLGVTYINDSFPRDSSSFYMGIYYTMAVIGPLVGIGLGGVLSHLDVNFLVYSSHKNLGYKENPKWVGCWWLGFLMVGVAAIIFSVPVFGLPKVVQGREKQSSLLREAAWSDWSLYDGMRSLPKAMLHTLSNPRFIVITLAACCEGIIFSGMAAFFTKILLIQFNLSSQKQAIFKAIIAIPSSLIGLMAGGWIIRILKMELQQILLMIFFFMLISFPCIGGVFIYCTQEKFVGITHPYKSERTVSLKSECNTNCSCDPSMFNPVCGEDGRSYLNACYAGCTRRDEKDFVDHFNDCKCVFGKNTSATDGNCQKRCPELTLFIALLFTYQTMTFLCLIPTVTSTIRVLSKDTTSLGVALQWVLGRLLGTIPGPLIFGLAFDDACQFWSEDNGNCLKYKSLRLSRNLALIIFPSKLVQILLYVAAFYLVKHSGSDRVHRRISRVSITSLLW